ncbi:MAG: S41 family peptidase [Bacteroidetes bacterium]|nr:S41 family peptidase [Bacteroidota bacterium]
MKNWKLLFLFFIFHTQLSVTAIAQLSDVDFVIEKIRKDYFPLGMSKDSVAFEKFIKEKLNVPITDTFQLISSITNFFGDQHLICYQRQQVELPGNSLRYLNPKELFIKINKGIKKGDRFTGFWLNDLGTEVIGILRDQKFENSYNGYVYQSADSNTRGRLVLRFTTNDTSVVFCEFINAYFQYRLISPLKFISENEFQIWSYSRWKKLRAASVKNKSKVKEYDYRASVISNRNGIIVFKIPEHSQENVIIVDSLVKKYQAEIENARVLIIDIRNNPGGTIRTYSKLLPYIYTNMIVRPDGLSYISDDLIAYEERSLKNLDSIRDKDQYQQQVYYIDSLKKNKGTRVLIKGKNKVFDKVYSKPLKVGLLVNYGCMSAAEAMILDIKQSKKALVFGENSAGAIDNLNTFAMRAPSGKYSMWMPTYRVIPSGIHNYYSGKGILPDIKIQPSVKDWIKFVKNYFEKN